MPKTKQINMSPEEQRLLEQLHEVRAKNKQEKALEEARQTLAELESDYDNAKRIFFAVNGARRVIKNAQAN